MSNHARYFISLRYILRSWNKSYLQYLTKSLEAESRPRDLKKRRLWGRESLHQALLMLCFQATLKDEEYN